MHKWFKDAIHQGLEGLCGIRQPKGHYQPLEVMSKMQSCYDLQHGEESDDTWNEDRASKKYCAPYNLSKSSSAIGIGKASLMVITLRAL